MIFNPITSDNPSPDKEYPASMRAILFESSGKKLLGTFFIAEGKGPNQTILLLHGFPGNETNFDLAHAARRAGWNVMVFHYRGTWGSEGDFSWNNSLEDTETAINFIKSDFVVNEFKVDKNKLVIIGHSMGGFLGMMSAANNSSINDCAYLGGFNFGLFGDLLSKNDFAKQLTLENLHQSVQMIKGADSHELLAQILEYSNEWNLLKHLNKLVNKNILMVGAKYDNISLNEIHHTPLANAFNKAATPFFTEYMLETGHSFSDKRIRLTEIIIDWLNKIKF